MSLRGERGQSMPELLMVMLITSFVLAAISGVIVAGLRGTSDSSSRLAGQQNSRLAVDRLEFEARCASGATVGGSGANVQLTLPSECVHATGTYTWCVDSGSLIRYSGAGCSGTAQTFATTVTTATPFTLVTATGYLPRLQIALSINAGGRSDAVSVSDVITLRNAARS